MKLMFPKNPFASALLTFFILSLMLAGSLSAQSRRNAHNKSIPSKAVAKKTEKRGKDARKERSSPKLTARQQAKADAQAKRDPKKGAESKKALAERRRKEEESRQAALAEQRRREQAAREARARKLAFERGLRNETASNI